MADTGELDVVEFLAPVVRLPLLLATAELPMDATRFMHQRRLPPVPPARPRP